MLGKRQRTTTAAADPSSAPLTPPKRPLTAHLSSTKAALAASPTSANASKGLLFPATPASSDMRRSNSQKENGAVGVMPLMLAQHGEDKVESAQAMEVDVGKQPASSPMHDDLFDVAPSYPSSSTSQPTGERAIPHIYAHASLLLSTSSSLSSSLPLHGRSDQLDTLRAFLSRRFPSVYAPLPSAASSSTAPTPSTPHRPGPASMYVSGPPGIGKTALLSSVLSSFVAQISERDLEGAVKVHMENCATVAAGGATEAAWERLARGLGIEEQSGGEKMKARERFEEGIKDGRKYLLVLDEIDHLVSASSARSSSSSSAPDLLNSLFALASTPASPLTLIGIANDLTLKALSLSPATTPTKSTGSGKGKAKLDPLHAPAKPVRLHFKPYTWQELVSIVAQRLALLAPSYPYLPPSSPEELPSPPPTPPAGKPNVPLLAPPALERLCKKIATTTGDVRTALSLARATIAASLPPSLSTGDLAALTPSTAPKASMAHLSQALAAASFAGSGLAPPPSLSKRLDALQAGPHHRLVLCACVVALSRALSAGDKAAGLDALAAEGAKARVTLDDAFRAYRDVVVPSAEALRATKLDQAAFGEAVGMVEDLCGAVLVRGRPGAGAGGSPSKGRGSRTPTKKGGAKGAVTVELAASAPLPELVAALTVLPKEGEEGREDEPARLCRRVIERERGEQRWRVKRREMGRDEERRAEEELEGREWERKVKAAEWDKEGGGK
ncbi:hypothetical protein JCM8097_006469 [Rhodosporidiobolus ruineniae]